MRVQKIAIERITVPEHRVTAVYDEELTALLRDTIEKAGVLSPITLIKAGENYRLVDGLHRLQEERANGKTVIDAVVYEGEEKDSLLLNLVMNRTRGKTKASELAKVIQVLYQEYGMDTNAIRDKTGISREYIEKLLKVCNADPAVVEALDDEAISLGHASEIARLPHPLQQEEVVAKCRTFKFPVKELKALIDQTLSMMQASVPKEAPYEPQPPRVFRCGACERETDPKYLAVIQVCPDCYGNVWRMGKATKDALEAKREAPVEESKPS